MFYHNYSLISDPDNFIRKFDKEMHRYLYQEQMQSKNFVNRHIYFGSIPFYDCQGFKSCQVPQGKWKFVADRWDYSCGVYKSLEVLRQAIFSAMQVNKKSMEMVLISDRGDSELLKWIPYDRESDHYIDAERIKRQRAYLFSRYQAENCKCDIHIPRAIFFKFIQPVLEKLFESAGMKFSFVVLENIVMNQRSGPSSSVYFKKDLHAIRIEWQRDQLHEKKEEFNIKKQKRQRPHSVNVQISPCERPWLEENYQKAIQS
jgi:hypothetical protein